PIPEIRSVVDRFRTVGRTFLNVQEEPESDDGVIDISHESLIRQWTRLGEWAAEEAEAKRGYLDLVNAIERKKELLRGEDLQVALTWRQRTNPTEDWARRYDPRFKEAMAYLDAGARRKRWRVTGALALVIIGVAVAVNFVEVDHRRVDADRQ